MDAELAPLPESASGNGASVLRSETDECFVLQNKRAQALRVCMRRQLEYYL